MVSLGLQLADTAQELRTFWRNVRDAPGEICTMTRELDLLSNVLTSIAFKAQNESIDENLTAALGNCTRGIMRLRETVVEFHGPLETGQTRKRKWTAIKAAWKKESITEFRQSIEVAKSTLLVALQASLE